jgi:hypothetical protein
MSYNSSTIRECIHIGAFGFGGLAGGFAGAALSALAIRPQFFPGSGPGERFLMNIAFWLFILSGIFAGSRTAQRLAARLLPDKTDDD